MILHCRHLINQDNNYKEDIKEKLLSLQGLKCVTMSLNDLSPISAVEEFEAIIPQIVETEAEREKYSYLITYVYMTNLAFHPDSERYDNAISAINMINESTPILPSKAVGCFNSALRFYEKSEDKVAAKELLQLLGTKMAVAKENKIADLGLSLIDYGNFSKYVRNSFSDDDSDDSFASNTGQLLDLMRRSPPKAENTFIVLLQLPEHYLQLGNSKLAARILAEIETAAAGTNERFRDRLQNDDR